MDRVHELRNELLSLLKPDAGDVYMNHFGTMFMLINDNRAIRLRTDDYADICVTHKKWDEIVGDPYMEKIGSIKSAVESADFEGRLC